MSEQLELGILLAPSSSAGDSPARISRGATPKGSDWLGRAPAFGGNSLGSFAQFCPDLWSLKTYQCSLLEAEGSTLFSGKLPKAGTMRTGILSALEPSGRAIDVTDFSSSHGFEILPTPTASQYGSSQNGKRADGSTFKQAGKPGLQKMARLGLLGDPGKLSVQFVRWMMGFPAGWLCSEP